MKSVWDEKISAVQRKTNGAVPVLSCHVTFLSWSPPCVRDVLKIVLDFEPLNSVFQRLENDFYVE